MIKIIDILTDVIAAVGNRVDICIVNLYKVMFEDNVAVSATIVDNLQPGYIGLHPDDKTIQWLVLECPDQNSAIEIAGLVARKIWNRNGI